MAICYYVKKLFTGSGSVTKSHISRRRVVGVLHIPTVLLSISVLVSGCQSPMRPSMIYVANTGSDGVSVIDGSSHKVVDVIPVGIQPRAMAANQKSRLVYTANIGADSVTVIDGNHKSDTYNTAIKTIEVGSQPLDIVINQSTNQIYVSNLNGGSVSVIDADPASATFHSVTDINTRYGSFALAVYAKNNFVYVTNPFADVVDVLDGDSNLLTHTISLPQGGGGVGASLNSRTGMLYVSAEGGRPVYVIDIDPDSDKYHTVIKEITLPSSPTAACCPFDIEVHDDTNTIYAPDQMPPNTGGSRLSGSVALIDGATNSITGDIAVGFAPKFAEIDTTTARLYVSNTDGNGRVSPDTVSVIDIDPNSNTFHTVIATVVEGIGDRPGDFAILSSVK